MLATVRIGAIHSVVFGGFAAASLATRIDDAQPEGDGHRRRRHARRQGRSRTSLWSTRRCASRAHPPRERDHRRSRPRSRDGRVTGPRPRLRDAAPRSTPTRSVPCEWLESSEPSYILYTSGTTGKPKGVQRDTGGYAVALAASMRDIFCVGAGRDHVHDQRHRLGGRAFVHRLRAAASTARRRSCTRACRSVPIPAIWWQIVAEHKVRTMFSSPTAIRVLKKQDPAFMKKHDVSALRYLFLAGEPLDEPTARWVADALGVPIVDNYWQTESGWPILSAQPGIEDTPRKFGSPSFPVCGYDVRLLRRNDRRGGRRRRERRADDRAAAAAGLHDARSGATTSASSRPTSRPSPASRCIRPSTGRCATPTATTSCSDAPMT